MNFEMIIVRKFKKIYKDQLNDCRIVDGFLYLIEWDFIQFMWHFNLLCSNNELCQTWPNFGWRAV